MSLEADQGDEHRDQALGSTSSFDPRLSHVAFGDIWTFLSEMSVKCASVTETGLLHVAAGGGPMLKDVRKRRVAELSFSKNRIRRSFPR